VTTGGDSRITRVGAKIRDYRLDEISQLIDVLRGTMTFVGTRPEVPRYTEKYTDEMMATLLLPAGVTSTASIEFKDEAKMLDSSDNVDKAYVELVLPQKMSYNLEDVLRVGALHDLSLLVKTIAAVANNKE